MADHHRQRQRGIGTTVSLRHKREIFGRAIHASALAALNLGHSERFCGAINVGTTGTPRPLMVGRNPIEVTARRTVRALVSEVPQLHKLGMFCIVYRA